MASVTRIGGASPEGCQYQNITAAAPTTTTLVAGPGTLVRITFNKPVATGTVAIHDALTAVAPLIGTITTPASPIPVTLEYNVVFSTGLVIVTGTAAQDITVCWRP